MHFYIFNRLGPITSVTDGQTQPPLAMTPSTALKSEA